MFLVVRHILMQDNIYFFKVLIFLVVLSDIILVLNSKFELFSYFGWGLLFSADF
jgi:hypothetical protein